VEFRVSEIIEVGTGEVRVSGNDDVLRSGAIGSCIVVVLFDREMNLGGFAHLMVPGRSPRDDDKSLRYVEDGMDALISKMEDEDSDIGSLEACVVGAGNVLKREDDTICDSNISSINDYLTQKNIPVKASALGGVERRSVKFDIESRKVFITTGDGQEVLLHQFRSV
jgi:chemotaxis protein CheD